MKYELTKEQYEVVKEVSQMKDLVDHMMNKDIGYFEMPELVNAFRNKSIRITE